MRHSIFSNRLITDGILSLSNSQILQRKRLEN
jgi:hypothetical protein